MIDLTPDHLQTVRRILAEYVPDCEVRAFGSRVTWTAKDYSDLDLAVVGARPLDADTLRLMKEAFEESDLPFRVDVLDWSAISEEFRKVIEAQYKVIQKGKMSSGGVGRESWRDVSVEEIAAPIDNALSTGPFGSAISSKYFTSTGIPVIRGSNLSETVETRLCELGLAFVSHQKAKEFSRSIARRGDLIFTCWGTIGQVGLIDERSKHEEYVVSNKQMKLSPDPNKADSLYLYYCFSGPLLSAQIKNEAIGSSVPGFNLGQLKKIRLRLPPLPEQRAIAHILGTLDDKIELNRRMSETLEAMARALFKSWFVDFDPIRAKMEGRWRKGRPLPGLPAHLYELFPTRLVDSELGMAPEGWGVGCVDDEFNLTMGQSPPGHTYNEHGEGLPFYQGCADFRFRFPNRRVYCTAPTRFAKEGDTLITVRAPVGDINMASEDCAIGRGVAAARHKTGSRSYSHQFMCSIKEIFARFETEGTVFGSIGKKDFHAIPCVVAPHAVVLEFEHCMSAIDSRIDVNERQSSTLATLRDTLLPKLISGEVRVKHAEKIIERVAP